MNTENPTTDTKAKTIAAGSNYRVEDPLSPPHIDAPALDSKESRTAMTKCLNALEPLTDDQRSRVVRAVAILFGVKVS